MFLCVVFAVGFVAGPEAFSSCAVYYASTLSPHNAAQGGDLTATCQSTTHTHTHLLTHTHTRTPVHRGSWKLNEACVIDFMFVKNGRKRSRVGALEPRTSPSPLRLDLPRLTVGRFGSIAPRYTLDGIFDFNSIAQRGQKKTQQKKN